MISLCNMPEMAWKSVIQIMSLCNIANDIMMPHNENVIKILGMTLQCSLT